MAPLQGPRNDGAGELEDASIPHQEYRNINTGPEQAGRRVRCADQHATFEDRVRGPLLDNLIQNLHDRFPRVDLLEAMQVCLIGDAFIALLTNYSAYPTLLTNHSAADLEFILNTKN